MVTSEESNQEAKDDLYLTLSSWTQNTEFYLEFSVDFELGPELLGSHSYVSVFPNA